MIKEWYQHLCLIVKNFPDSLADPDFAPIVLWPTLIICGVGAITTATIAILSAPK